MASPSEEIRHSFFSFISLSGVKKKKNIQRIYHALAPLFPVLSSHSTPCGVSGVGYIGNGSRTIYMYNKSLWSGCDLTPWVKTFVDLILDRDPDRGFDSDYDAGDGDVLPPPRVLGPSPPLSPYISLFLPPSLVSPDPALPSLSPSVSLSLPLSPHDPGPDPGPGHFVAPSSPSCHVAPSFSPFSPFYPFGPSCRPAIVFSCLGGGAGGAVGVSPSRYSRRRRHCPSNRHYRA